MKSAWEVPCSKLENLSVRGKKMILVQIDFGRKGCFPGLLSGSKSRQWTFLCLRETVTKFSQKVKLGYFQKEDSSPFLFLSFQSRCKTPDFRRRKHLIQKQNHCWELCLLKHKFAIRVQFRGDALHAGVLHVTTARGFPAFLLMAEPCTWGCAVTGSWKLSFSDGAIPEHKCNASCNRGTLCQGRPGLWMDLWQTEGIAKCWNARKPLPSSPHWLLCSSQNGGKGFWRKGKKERKKKRIFSSVILEEAGTWLTTCIWRSLPCPHSNSQCKYT